jgi:outer membrane autotransporter protein
LGFSVLVLSQKFLNFLNINHKKEKIIMENKFKLKKLLATASAFAVLAGASSAAAKSFTTDNAGAVVISGVLAPTNSLNHGGGPLALWAANDSYYLTHAKDITLGAAGAAGATVATLDVNGSATTVTVAEDSALASMINSGVAAVTTIRTNVGKSLTLGGNAGLNAGQVAQAAGEFTGLGNIILGTAGGNGTGVLTINSNATLTGTIDSDNVAGGVVNINTGKTATLNGVIGGVVGVDTINLEGAGSVATFGAAVKTKSLNIKNATAVANINGGNFVGAVSFVGDGKVNVGATRTITGNVDATVGPKGVLEFAGAGTLTGTVGAAVGLKQVNINNGLVAFTKTVKTADMNIKNVNSQVTLAGNTVVTAGLNFSADGKVTLDTTKKITGNVKNTVTGAVAAGVTTYADTGTLVLTGGVASEVTGTIGAVSKRLKLVDVTGGAAVALLSNANGQHYAKEFKLSNNNAIELDIAAGGKLHGNIITDGNNNRGIVKFLGAGEIDGVIGANGAAVAKVQSNGAKAVTIGAGDHHATAFDVVDVASSFIMKDGANLTGSFTSSTGAGAKGIVTFEGKHTITGNIGIVGNDFASIVLADDAELTISGVAPHVITGKISQALKSSGEIIVSGLGANDADFKSVIGDSASLAALKVLRLKGNIAASEVKLVGNSHIDKIIAEGASKLTLNAGNYKFGALELTEPDKLELNIADNAKILNPTASGTDSFDLGTTTKKLKQLSLTDNKILILQDGVNIAASKLNGSAVGGGTLILEGNNIIDATSTGANAIGDIEVKGIAGKVAKLVQNTTLAAAGNGTGLVTLTAAATLELGANLIAVSINGKAAHNEGTLRFVNSAASTIASKIGNTKTLKAIEFNGNDVNITRDVVHTGDFKFASANPTKVTFSAATDVGANNFVNASAAGIDQTVILNAAATTFTGNIASTTNRINFQLDDAKNARVNGGNHIGQSFTTTRNTKGALEFINANATDVIYSAGADGKTLASVTFTKNGTITNGTFAELVTVKAGVTANLGGEVKVVPAAGLALAGLGSTVNFLDGVKLNSKVIATILNKGVVTFAGGGSVEDGKDLGVSALARLNSVTFSDTVGKELTLNANIFANTVLLRKGTVKAGSNVTLNSPVITATNSAINLGSKVITVDSGSTLTFNGVNNKIDVVVAQSGNVITFGKIAIATGANVKFATGTKFAITPDDTNGARPTGGATRRFTLIDNGGNAIAAADQLALANVTVDSTKNPFTIWTTETTANNGLGLVQTDGAEKKIKEILGDLLDDVDAANISALAAAASGTDGAKFIDLLSTLTTDRAKMDEAINRLTSVTTSTDAIEGIMGNINNLLSTRLGQAGIQRAGVPVQSRVVASAKVTGVSAGDEHSRFGAWFSPFFSKTTQKARKGTAGYRDTSYGGSVGLDTRANDDLIIGGAFTFANSEMKHRDFKSGDKTKVNSLMFSVYAMQQITDTWFTQATATIGSNDVRNTENKVASATTFDAVKSKYSSMSFNGEVLFGYNCAHEDFSLTPMGGLRYSRVNSAGYKQNGSTTGQNLDVSQKSSDKLEVILGARVSGGTFDLNGMAVTPELHGFINHDIIGKNPKQSQRIGGVTGSLGAKSSKPVKTTYNLGLGVNADYGMMEYGAGYDLNLAEKRVGHEGTLKVRVNF